MTAMEAGAVIEPCDIVAIKELIPHRYPFLLIDRILEGKAFEHVVALKNVSANEPFFEGHFPTDPIMPGVLIIEAMAQAAAAFAVMSRGRVGAGDSVYFMAIKDARFRRPVRPGDSLRLEVTRTHEKMGIWRFVGKAFVEGQLAAEAGFTARLMENTA